MYVLQEGRRVELILFTCFSESKYTLPWKLVTWDSVCSVRRMCVILWYRRPILREGKRHLSLLKQEQMQNSQLIEAIKLPTAQLAPFDGDPIKYWPFIRAFENCVACSLVDDGAKLIRLVHYCTGQARKVIESCMVMQPAE